MKERLRRLETEVRALALACRDPRVPWFAKALAACVVGYALSPIDLIPDPIPILGHLDDVVLIPLGLLAVRRMIPAEVLAECRERARGMASEKRAAGGRAAIAIVTIWALLLVAAIVVLVRCSM